MEYFERHQGGEKTLLICVTIPNLAQVDTEEFRLLADSAGADVIDCMLIQRHSAEAKYLIGSGKAEEIASSVKAEEIDLVIFDQTLSPAQERNLERLCQCRVMDRTGLILDIFAQRARTHEGKLQVELAQLDHLSTRLVRGWTHLERQKGGIGLRGPGESQLETDRRLLRQRVKQLKDKLDKVRKTRAQGRAARQKADIATISLVGYTNAGKSTLFNRLASSDVHAADQLFATLDPTLRRLEWKGLGTVVLADTVGFVSHLPHSLVDSFHATLEETLEASLLLHVIDCNSADELEQISAVETVLSEIGVDRPILKVFNKIDLSGHQPRIIYSEPNVPQAVYLSAHSGAGLDLLQHAVRQMMLGEMQQYQLKIPFEAAKLRHQLYQLKVVDAEYTLEDGTIQIDATLPARQLKKLIAESHLDLEQVLSGIQLQQLKPILEEFETPQPHSSDESSTVDV